MEELYDLELEIPDDRDTPEPHRQDIETFLMTSDELERSTAPPRRDGRKER